MLATELAIHIAKSVLPPKGIFYQFSIIRLDRFLPPSEQMFIFRLKAYAFGRGKMGEKKVIRNYF